MEDLSTTSYWGDPNRQGTTSLKALRAVHESRIASYTEMETEYRLEGRKARKEGRWVDYHNAVAGINRYKQLIANEREELRRLG